MGYILPEVNNVAADHNALRQTPLSKAAQNGDKVAIQQLLTKTDVDPNAATHSGWTALTFAASNGHTTVVRLLLQRCDVNRNARAQDGSTPLICSAWNGHGGVARLILDCGGVDADAKNEAGQTALWCAARNGHYIVIQLLLERNDVDVNSNDALGRTPLIVAACKGHQDVVRLLVGKDNVDVNYQDRRGRTALLHASSLGHTAIVKLLRALWNDQEAVARLLATQGYLRLNSKGKQLRSGGQEAIIEQMDRATNGPPGDLDAEDPRRKSPSSQTTGSGNQHIPRAAALGKSTHVKHLFNQVKQKLATEFLKELDEKVASGKISALTTSTGGVTIIWNTKFKSTAGRANWTGKEVTGQSCKQYRHTASIELADEIINDESKCTICLIGYGSPLYQIAC